MKFIKIVTLGGEEILANMNDIARINSSSHTITFCTPFRGGHLSLTVKNIGEVLRNIDKYTEKDV